MLTAQQDEKGGGRVAVDLACSVYVGRRLPLDTFTDRLTTRFCEAF